MELESVAIGDPPGMPARRQAEDLRRIRADVTDARCGEPLESRDVDAFGGQHRPLVAGPAEGVLAEQAVRPYDPVARHDQRHRVVPESGSHCADGFRAPDLRRDPAVRPDLATRDPTRLRPDVAL